MHPRHALTLQTQLVLPLIPFAIDLGARLILLWNKVPWYELPDLWTLLITYAFFCIGLMVAIRTPSLPSDQEADVLPELVRQRLLAIGIVSVTLAGAISVFRAMNELLPDQHLYETHGLALFCVVVVFVGCTLFRISSTYLSYVGRAD
jgi:hypothetical protein